MTRRHRERGQVEPYVTMDDLDEFLTLPEHERLLEIARLHGQQEWLRQKLAGGDTTRILALLAITVSAMAFLQSVDDGTTNSVTDSLFLKIVFNAGYTLGLILAVMFFIHEQRYQEDAARYTARLAAFEQAHQSRLS